MRFKPSVWLFVAAVGLGARGILAVGQAPETVDPWQALAAPTLVPGAPVLSHSVVGTTVFLTWSPAGSGGVPTGYVLEASLSPGGAALTAFQVGVTTLTVPNVPAGTYFVRVRAVNGEGSGPPSNEVTVVVGAPCAQPPGAPGTLVGSPPGPTVTLTWSPPAGGGCPATHFVLRAGFARGQPVFGIPVGTNTSFSGTAAPGTYFVSVAAANAAGQGPPSNEVQVVIECAAPGPPVGLNATVDGSTVTLGWSPPASGGAAAGYVLEAGSSSGAIDVASFDLPANSFSTVAPNGTYFVRVRATNACGVSPPSNEATVVVPNCGPTPGAPSTPSATVNGGTATISWTAVNGASSYRLEVGTSSGASNTTSQLVSGTSQQLTNLSSGNYFMRVRALNACGSAGPASGEGSFTVANPVTLTSITVTGPGSLVIGQSGQFTATARFSDGSSANWTSTAAWASSNGTVAAPASPGLINARGLGTVNITASRDGQTGTATLQVVQPTASFVVDPGQCRVTVAPNTAQNHLLCTFDGGASTANATYAWEIPAGSGRCGDNPCPNSNVVDGRTLRYGCGSFGGAGRFPVRLRVTFGGVTVEQTQMIEFVRFQAC